MKKVLKEMAWYALLLLHTMPAMCTHNDVHNMCMRTHTHIFFAPSPVFIITYLRIHTTISYTQQQELPMQAKPPAELQRRFEVVIHPRTTALPRKMRDIDARCLGSLVTLRGIVTQVTDIKPLITVACYLDDSGVEWYQEVKGGFMCGLSCSDGKGGGVGVDWGRVVYGEIRHRFLCDA